MTNHQTSHMEERIVFFLVAMGVITLTLGFLALIDFLPEEPASEAVMAEEEVITPEAVSFEAEPAMVSGEPFPVSIHIGALDRTVTVLNPQTSDIPTLDAALLSGVVRHPESADFVNTGTMFLLGHSSHLPVVRNKNFQAFNDIETLSWGDTIRVRSGDMEYVYSVDRVYEAKASVAEVPLQFDVPKLILATCNSFGTKDDRFIVEASLVSKRPYNG